jgi:2,3-dimethylmalate lyase
VSAAARLRALISGPDCIVVPGTATPLMARLVESAGFPVAYMTGAGTSAMQHGYPDMGLLTMTEMVENAGRMAEAVDIPVLSDADTGFGAPLNVRRTVREFERRGVAGIHLEDQDWPKRCGHYDGKQVIPQADMVAKLRAAVDAREDPDFVIIARCDALAVTGWDDTLRRCEAYQAAGADMLFVEALRTEEQMRQLVAAVDVPLVLNVVLGGKTPELTREQAEEIGFRILLMANPVLYAEIRAVRRLLERLRRTGDITSLAGLCTTFDDFHDTAGRAAMTALDSRYAVPPA